MGESGAIRCVGRVRRIGAEKRSENRNWFEFGSESGAALSFGYDVTFEIKWPSFFGGIWPFVPPDEFRDNGVPKTWVFGTHHKTR